MSSCFFDIRDLSVRYSGHLALEGVSLQVVQGEVLAIIGPSGCGKTSFLCALNRLTDLISHCQVSGEILLQGTSIQQIEVTRLRRRVGKIFQRPNPFPMSIRRNICLPLQEHGVRDRSEQEGRMEQVLRRVGLWPEVSDRLDGNALKLSGGQQQRLCIARALVLEPEALLMDEPCSALDPISMALVEDLMLDLRGSYTLIVATHNLAQARRIADKLAVFWNEGKGGLLLEHGVSSQVFERPNDPRTAAYVSGRRG